MKALPILDAEIHKAWYAAGAADRVSRDLTNARDWHIGLRVPEDDPFVFVWHAPDGRGGFLDRYQLAPEIYPRSRNAHPRGEY